MLSSQTQTIRNTKRSPKPTAVKSRKKPVASGSISASIKRVYKNTYSTKKIKTTNSETGGIISLCKDIINNDKIFAEDITLIEKANTILDEFLEMLKPPTAENLQKKTGTENSAPTKEIDSEKDRYEYLLKYGTQILALFTESGECSYLSKNFAAITGKRAESLLGDRFFSIVHSDFKEKLFSVLNRKGVSASFELPPQIMRLRIQHSDKKYYWYQFTIHTKTAQHVCIIENINDHMQTQNTLQKARLEAELALRTRSEFLANMSHELRTPLNAVIGFSQIMEKGIFGKIENPKYCNYIRHIQESGHDLLSRIEDLLEISNIDAGRVSLECEEIYIDELVKHVMKTQSHHAKSAGITLSYVPRGNLLLFVDRLKIQHALSHLVANAIKFTETGGEVTVAIERDGKSGIRIAVHDNGVGINELKCHDIRESLQQDNCWTAKNSHSIGIGLALTKEFAALHGGNVEIISSVGIGTTISMALPRSCIRITPTQRTELKKHLEPANG